MAVSLPSDQPVKGQRTWQDVYALNGQSAPSQNNDSGTALQEQGFGDLGFSGDPKNFNASNGLNDKFLANLGWTGGNPYVNPGEGKTTTEGGQELNGPSGYTPEFLKFIKDKGLTFKSIGTEDGKTNLQAFDVSGKPVGTPYKQANVSNDAFGVGAMAGAGLAGAAAAGAFSGAGAFGTGAAADGAGGMALAEGATPSSLTSGAGTGLAGPGAASGAATGTSASMVTPSAVSAAGGTAGATGGTGLLGTGYSLGQIASAASTAASLAGKAGLLGGAAGSDGSTLSAIGAAALNLYSASKAGDAQDKAVAIQEGSAAQQTQIAQDQWDYHKNIYLPKATQMADDSAARTDKIAGDQSALAAFNTDVEKQAVQQGMKSYAYQDEYMRMTDKYANGEMANTMADESHADVQQAAARERAASDMAMQRRGINASSGAGMALRSDNDLATAAADAGGQTAARRYARDKAEAMVATVANAGTATIGQGLQAGSLATGANANAVGASTSGTTTENSVGNTLAYGAGAAGSNASGAGQTGYRLGNTYGGSLVADAGAGTLTGLAKTGSGLLDSMGNAVKGMTWNGGAQPPVGAGMPGAFNTDTGTSYRPSDNYGDQP